MHSRCIPAHSRRIRDILAGFQVACRFDSPSKAIRMFRMLLECRNGPYEYLECSQSAFRIHFECRSIFFHFVKTIGPATRMGPNIWNALRLQSEFLECTSNIQECRMNFHSDGIPALSASSVTRVLYLYATWPRRPAGYNNKNNSTHTSSTRLALQNRNALITISLPEWPSCART